ncbi:hypothetical protein HS125_01370 [bacterium]|nr:hypothetical protein [bacterium]
MKEFDCVAMKRQAQEAIDEAIKGMSAEEQIDCFRRESEASLRKMEEMRKRRKNTQDGLHDA